MAKKHVPVGKTQVYDQAFYAHVIGLLASTRDIDFDDVLAHELAAYSPFTFDPEDNMNISKLLIWDFNCYIKN